jgi:hypothetical protein
MEERAVMQGRMRIGIIGGNGWLGRAFAEAMVDAGIAAARELTLSYRSGHPSFFRDASWTSVRDGLAAALRKSVSMGQAS